MKHNLKHIRITFKIVCLIVCAKKTPPCLELKILKELDLYFFGK